MQLQNSYIFLPNPYKEKLHSMEKQDGVIYFEIGHSFIGFLKKAFPNMSKLTECDNYFKSEYAYSINIGSIVFDVKFIINVVVETYYLDVVVTGKSKAQIVTCLEYIQSAIDNSDVEKDYIQIISYDAVSEYYCNKIYPKLNELERNLRKLLFNIYVVNFGREYYQATVSTELQNKIKKVIQAKGNSKSKEIVRLKNFFYSLEFIDIQELLFVPHWTNIDEQAKIDFLNKHRDLSSLSNEELRKAFIDIAPKNDWDRFFVGKIGTIDVQTLIAEIRKSRNNIAHCKFFYREEYSVCSEAMGKLNRAIKYAITITEEQDFVDKNSESIRKAFSSGMERFQKAYESINKAILSTSELSSVLTPLTNILSNLKEQLIKPIQFTQILKPIIDTNLLYNPLLNDLKGNFEDDILDHSDYEKSEEQEEP